MRSVICVHERFDAQWPFAADYWHERWREHGPCELYRSQDRSVRAPQLVPDPASVQRLVLLGFHADSEDLAPFSALEECYHNPHRNLSSAGIEEAAARGVSFIPHREDIYWGQSVAEFALGLTICALRRIPQTYAAMMQSHGPWDYMPAVGQPGQRGAQFGDDTRFTNGTLAGKRVRIVGAGNIGGRYASWCAAMGAQVAIWDPFAPDASFALARAKRCFHLSELVRDSQIFAPMVPLTESTRGLIPKETIDALPHGSLVVQVTRAEICDTDALYRRVLNHELALAADVFDIEPVALDSPLLGRDNVVHTPHNAGRTIDANQAWVEDQIARFRPR
jgi:phosphoglycerate dehydrogenase-like enzyme